MPPTTTDYIQLINAAGGSPTPDGWTVLLSPDTNATIGISTAAYYNASGQIVIAFQPVSTPARNGAANTADAAIFGGSDPGDFNAAIIDYVGRVVTAASKVGENGLFTDPSNVFVTGHSLGGYAAQFAARSNQYGGANFGGPGIPNYNGTAPNPNGFVNYIDAGDPIGNYALDTGFDWNSSPSDKLGYHFGEIAPNVGAPSDRVRLQNHISLLSTNPGSEDQGGTALAGSSLLLGDVLQHHLFGSYEQDFGVQASSASNPVVPMMLFAPIIYIEKQFNSGVPTITAETASDVTFASSGGSSVIGEISDDNNQSLSVGNSGSTSILYAIGSNDVIKVNSSGKAGIVLNDAVADPTSGGQGGNDLILLPKSGLDNPVQIVFGKGSGHAVIESPIADDTTIAAKFLADGNGAYDQIPSSLGNLHIVLAGLQKSDVTFFYKQQDYYANVVGKSYHDPDAFVGTSRFAGYIKINSTGETLVLPDEALDRQMFSYRFGGFNPDDPQGGSSATDAKSYIIAPASFSITFADGTTYAGADAAKLFTEAEPTQMVFWDHIAYSNPSAAITTSEGLLQNAPDQYLGAEQNSGGVASTSVTATQDQSSVPGDAGANTIDSAGFATTATGGGGNDAYVYNVGYGPLTIDNFDAANNGNEGVVQFGQGITASELSFSRVNVSSPSASTEAPSTAFDDLSISVSDGSNSDTVRGGRLRRDTVSLWLSGASAGC